MMTLRPRASVGQPSGQPRPALLPSSPRVHLPPDQGSQLRLPEGRCPEPATAKSGPLLQRRCAWESARVHAQQPHPGCSFASTLRLPGTRRPPTLRSTLLASRLQPQSLSNSPAGVSHARVDRLQRILLPKHRLPALRSSRPGAWLRTRQTGLRGRLGPRGTCHPRGPLSAVLCVRAANPSAERLPRRRLACKREGEDERGTARGLEGVKTTALSLGRFRHGAAFGPLLDLSPAPLPRPAGAGANGDGGGAEPRGPRWKWCFRSCREGVKHCFGFAKEI